MSAHRSHTLVQSLARAAELLRCGQAHEVHGELAMALTCYDDAIAALRVFTPDDVEARRALGVAWMNRGNALQKTIRGSDGGERPEAGPAVAAYDEAIALLGTLPPAVAAYRNHLGAAWLNRGHALIGSDDTAAARSFQQSIAILRELPLGESPAYRLNLAGAWINLAHVEIAAAPVRAHAAATEALKLVSFSALDDLASAEMSLRARRAAVMALGELLRVAESAREPIDALAAEASDAIDDGLALARRWEGGDGGRLRPLALRLFRLGAQVYRLHQPHFLAEFLLENLAPGAFAEDPGFLAAADEALTQALNDVQRPRLLVAGTPIAEKFLATARSLRVAQARLAALNSNLTSILT